MRREHHRAKVAAIAALPRCFHRPNSERTSSALSAPEPATTLPGSARDGHRNRPCSQGSIRVENTWLRYQIVVPQRGDLADDGLREALARSATVEQQVTKASLSPHRTYVKVPFSTSGNRTESSCSPTFVSTLTSKRKASPVSSGEGDVDLWLVLTLGISCRGAMRRCPLCSAIDGSAAFPLTDLDMAVASSDVMALLIFQAVAICAGLFESGAVRNLTCPPGRLILIDSLSSCRWLLQWTPEGIQVPRLRICAGTL
jgi:hypothetical protein